MQMHPARRISEAIGSWLHFEFCCYRAGLFSENSLKAAVGQVLSSFPITAKGERVYADFAHDLLNPQPSRAGRKKELDFALVLAGDGLPKQNAQIAIETKWAGSSHCTPEKIFQDFLRLASIKKGNQQTTCLFVLAGKHGDISKILKNMPFISEKKPNIGIGCSGKPKRLKPDHTDPCHKKCFSTPIKELTGSGFVLPESFVSQAHGLHPRQTDSGTVDFQSIAWEITEVESVKNLKTKLW